MKKIKIALLLTVTLLTLTLTAWLLLGREKYHVTSPHYAPLTIWFNEEDNFNSYRSELVVSLAALQDENRRGESVALELNREISNDTLAESSGLMELTEFYYPNVDVLGLELQKVTIQRGGFNFDYSPISTSTEDLSNWLTVTIINAETDCPYLVAPPSATIEFLAELYGNAYRNTEVRDDLIFIKDDGFSRVIGLLDNTRFYVTVCSGFDVDELHRIAVLISENAELVNIEHEIDRIRQSES
jgi:hypothetical protein